jgi:hypothetical protein
MSNLTEAASEHRGTGPYRRIWSQQGFSAVRATVFLPGIAQGGVSYSQSGDTAFVYAGGWGNGDQALDAGFMHNPGTDTWSLFIKFGGNPEYLGSDPSTRLKPGQSVTFTFWVPNDGSLRVECSGNAVKVLDAANQNDLGYLTLAVQYDGASGFPQSGSGVVLKRMTSIAQDSENFGCGSKLIGVEWSDVMIGTDPSALAPWSIVAPGGTMRYSESVVEVDYQSDSHETVSIRI